MVSRWFRTGILKAVFLVCLALPLAADTVIFTLLPTDGNVSGPAGSTVGWGYSIANNSDTDWFVSTNLNPDSSFLDGIPTALFDFPDLAPDTTATESFDSVSGIGLYEFVWDPAAPAGDTNSGNF